jgi:hypothetical protein
MTTTINASTSTGLVSTADTSGIIKVQSNGVTTNALAWARLVGSTATISSSYNVSSITRSSAGNYLVNFATAVSDTNYAVAGVGDAGSTYYLLTSKISANTTSAAGLQLINAATVAGDGVVSVVIFGN